MYLEEMRQEHRPSGEQMGSSNESHNAAHPLIAVQSVSLPIPLREEPIPLTLPAFSA